MTSFTVTTTADGGAGSLRDLIGQANASPGADTIVVPAGTYALTGGVLDIADDLTITGADAATTVIDGGGLDDIFRAVGDVAANFSGLTIRNAGGQGAGVGILAANATINVTACTLANNPVAAIQTNGGAVSLDNSTVGGTGASGRSVGIQTRTGAVTVAGSTVSGNAIGISSSSGDLTVTGSDFNNNGDGLGTDGTVTAADSTFSHNEIGYDGIQDATATNCTFSDNEGDGIDGSRDLTLTGCTFSDNGGDGVDGSRDDTITNCTFDDNGGDGVDGASIITVVGSTFSNNNDGINGGSALTIINSTVSGNTTGINSETVALNFVTIADNELDGIDAGSLTIGNTILSAPGGGQTSDVELITSRGHNIVSDDIDASRFTQPGDRINTDPLLGPLADNGGPTRTQALLPGSPAIDAADGSGSEVGVDQRGVPRPQGAGFDIGAFELQAAGAAPSADLAVTVSPAPDPVAAGGTLTYTITVADAGPDPAQAVTLADGLPAGTTFVSFTAPAGWTPTTPAVGGTGTVSASLPTLPSGAPATFTLVVRVAPGSSGGATIADTASVAATTVDPDSANDTDTRTVTVSAPVVVPTAAPTMTVLGADLNPATVGQAVTFAAVVGPTSGPGAPSGSVTFVIDGVVQPPVALTDVGGHELATLTTSALTAGTHHVVATYGGDAGLGASLSNLITEVVNPVPVVLPPPSPITSPSPTPAPTPAPIGDGPTVMAVERFGYHRMPTTLLLAFTAPLDPARAQDPANYRIATPRGRPVGIAWARYDAASWTVMLRPGARLNVHHPYRLTIIGTGPSGVADASGRLLDGAGTGSPGSDYATSVGWSDLVLTGTHPAGPSALAIARSSRRPPR